MKGFMDGVPLDLEQAAWVDGATWVRLAAGWIVAPLMMPGHRRHHHLHFRQRSGATSSSRSSCCRAPASSRRRSASTSSSRSTASGVRAAGGVLDPVHVACGGALGRARPGSCGAISPSPVQSKAKSRGRTSKCTMTVPGPSCGRREPWTRGCAPGCGPNARPATWPPFPAATRCRWPKRLAARLHTRGAGDALGAPWSTTWFRVSGQVPAAWAGRRVEAVVDLGFNDRGPGFQAEGLAYGPDGAPLKAVQPRNNWLPVQAPVLRRAGPVLSRRWPCPGSWARGTDDRFRADRPGRPRPRPGTSPAYVLGGADLVVVDEDAHGLGARRRSPPRGHGPA